jgi:hypothetical protein
LLAKLICEYLSECFVSHCRCQWSEAMPDTGGAVIKKYFVYLMP